MKSFDYEQYRVVGLVEDKFGDNATIDVIGYCDDYFHVFQLTHLEVLDLFPTRGKVFAYKFSLYHENLKGRIACLYVQPSNNDGPENYVWDWNGKVEEYGKKISTLKGVFSNDGQHNYDILKNNNLLDVNEEELVHCEDRIYQISPDCGERVIKYWEASSLNMVTVDGIKYFIGTSLPKHDGLIDITNDEQIANWYLSKVLKKNWASITQSKSFRNSESFLTELLTSMKNLDESTLQCRLNRLKAINTNLSLTFDSLKEIAETPWFGDVVMKSIVEERARLLEQMKKDNDSELNKIKENHELELLRIEEKQDKEVSVLRQRVENVLYELSEQERTIEERLQEKNFEIELLDETEKEKRQTIAALEELIANLNDRKASIIQDFSIIREVLNIAGKTEIQTVKEDTKRFSLEEVNFSEKPISRFQAYVKSLENILKANGAQKISPLIMGKMLIKYYVVLCPSASIAQTFILASQKCKYLTEYVSVKWSSFEDLWKNGLAYIVSKSMEETDIMHFLLLQNINISYLPNFLQPLVDLQKGIITKFPASDISYPQNLRILCTIAEEELIKMPASALRNFGCIDKSFHFEPLGAMKFVDGADLGYLTPDKLSREGEQYIEIQNMFEQYIDE